MDTVLDYGAKASHNKNPSPSMRTLTFPRYLLPINSPILLVHVIREQLFDKLFSDHWNIAWIFMPLVIQAGVDPRLPPFWRNWRYTSHEGEGRAPPLYCQPQGKTLCGKVILYLILLTLVECECEVLISYNSQPTSVHNSLGYSKSNPH